MNMPDAPPAREGPTASTGPSSSPRPPDPQVEGRDRARTIPGRSVTIFDRKGKGCKVLIGEMNRLRTSLLDKGKSKKPAGPEWYILGRDQAKFLPAKRPAAVMRNKRAGLRFLCPRCGRTMIDEDNVPLDPKAIAKLVNCDRLHAVEVSSGEATCGLDRKPIPRDSEKNLKDGMIREAGGKQWRVVKCNEPLWQFTAKPLRWAPAMFVHRKMRGAFRYLIVDEVHEQKSDEAAQAIAMGRLVASCRYTLALTGTIVGGYADHLFPLLFRFSPAAMVAEGQQWGKDWRSPRGTAGSSGSSRPTSPTAARSPRHPTGARGARSPPRPSGRSRCPGIMPALFGNHLLDKTIFLGLEDMADNLPAFGSTSAAPRTPTTPGGTTAGSRCPPSWRTSTSGSRQAWRTPRPSSWLRLHEVPGLHARHDPGLCRPPLGLDGPRRVNKGEKACRLLRLPGQAPRRLDRRGPAERTWTSR